MHHRYTKSCSKLIVHVLQIIRYIIDSLDADKHHPAAQNNHPKQLRLLGLQCTGLGNGRIHIFRPCRESRIAFDPNRMAYETGFELVRKYD